MIRLFHVVFLMLLAFAQAAQADKAAVKCVQEQLNKLDFGAGAVDGALGPKTRAALARLKTDKQDMRFQAKLTRRNAIVLCRELGLLQPRLRAAWPGYIERFQTRYHPSISAENQDILSVTVSEALGRLANQFQISLAGKFTVLAAIEHKDMRRLIETTLGGQIDRHGFQKFMDQTCPKTSPISGFAGARHMAICFPGGNLDVKRNDLNSTGNSNNYRDLLVDVVFHEVVHIAQRQLAGYTGGGSQKSKLSNMGPEWLIEGTAQYLSLLAQLPRRSVTGRMIGLKFVAGGPSADISKYNTYEARRKFSKSLYIQGVLAAHHLAQIAGERALLNFYNDIGNGMLWPDAFKANFKLTPQQFYGMFAES